jgi:thioredoxin 1
MLERLALVLVLAAAAAALGYAFRLLHMRRMRPDAAIDRPTLLYFCSDTCAVCPTQGRFVDQLAAQWRDRLRIERIDAEREPETATRYRVFTLPTTILIDGRGQVQHVNYGLTDAHKLSRQLSQLEEEEPQITQITQILRENL